MVDGPSFMVHLVLKVGPLGSAYIQSWLGAYWLDERLFLHVC